MASYGGVTINVETDERGFIPRWSRKNYTSRTKPIGVSRENLQFGGRGNSTITLRLALFVAADFATLEGWENDGVARALVDPAGDGVNYPSVYLMEIRNAKKRSYAQEFEADVTFERVGG